MIYTKLPSPGMSWKGLNWTMWLHFHTVGKSCIWTICTAMSRLTMETLIWNFGGFQSIKKDQRLMKKLPCKLRFCKCKVLISASSVWLLPQRAFINFEAEGNVTHSASIPTNPMVEHLQVFTSPPKKMNKKYHTPYGCGTHLTPGPRKTKSAAAVLGVFCPPKVGWEAPRNCDFLWLPSNQYPEAHE